MKNYTDCINWTKVATHSEAGITVDEYIDDTRTLLKQVWDDGYIEIHEIAD